MPAVEQPTQPYNDQKPGTSGLRKKVTVFKQKNYVANFVQSTFNALRKTPEGIPDVLVVGGDGRYYAQEAIQTILNIAAGNGVKRVWVGKNGLLSTPAVSVIVRRREGGAVAKGAFILTASHNPGGPNADFGIKYNVGNGGPAPEKITAAIFDETLKVNKILVGSKEPVEVDLASVATVQYTEGMTVEVVDSLEDYVHYMKQIFDFDAIKRLLSRADFSLRLDCLHGASGPYVEKIFHEMLGVPMQSLVHADPLPDFGGCHPDPNLTYAESLVKAMGLKPDGSAMEGLTPPPPVFGAAFDGDADRCMILGRYFFVNPSDSLAVLAANANAVPFFEKAGGLKAVARSMPTSSAVDRVAAEKKFECFEVPTGWKFFGNLMDSEVVFKKKDHNPLLCGEESFGTGSNHIREKDGVWTCLFWLSVLAHMNAEGRPLATLKDIVEGHWAHYGRNYYSRYDYEGVPTESANAVMEAVMKKTAADIPELNGQKCSKIDNFKYVDPVDGSVSENQGVRVMFEDGSRFVLRLSGTGSSGATIRLYLEKYMDAATVKQHLDKNALPVASEALKDLIRIALEVSGIPKTTGRDAPTVIT